MKTSVLCTAALLTVLLAGCVAQPIVPTPAAVAAGVKPGDRVHLVTLSETEGDYRVVRVERESLYVQPIGRDHHMDPKVSIAYGDIRALTVTRANRTAITAGLAVATLFAGAMLYEAMEGAAAPALCC